ncbi:MAG TPA: LysR family transcriptional regulator [Xanthobacteraceae bacterium]|nr:LysR family transcriptional regulator [Xanthobacteraceae bacterium]
MIDFKALETFIWVANLKSFRRAADRLNTTQPAVSMRIAQLEQMLGIRLLERDKRLVAATPKGQELLIHAERLIRLRADMVESVGDRAAVRGIIRLGVSESIVHTWLPALIERVNAAYPNLELEIEVDISPNLHERLVARDLNLAFLVGPTNNPNAYSRPLCSFGVAFVASSRIKFPRKSIDLDDIVKWPIITFSRNTQPYINLRDLFARNGLRPTMHASASLATAVRMALDGIGIAVIPPAILKSGAPRDKLRQLATRIELPPLNFVASWPTTPDNPTARRVAEIAVDVAQKTMRTTAKATMKTTQ